MSNNKLIDEYPLILLPSLAVILGLNEALVLQQVHFLLQHTKHNYDNRPWIYNSYPQWVKTFPFFSESTVKRTIHSLERTGILIASNYNKLAIDKTKWYTIDYDKLEDTVGSYTQNDTHLKGIDPAVGSE